MNCPKCGAPLRENAAFCTACGAKVAPVQSSKLKSTMPMPEPAEPKPVETPAPEAPAAARVAEPKPVAQPAPAAPKKKEKKTKKPSKFIAVLHHVRAYLAVLLAVASIVLLFLPWINAAMEITVEDVKVRNSKQDVTYGDIDAENELSILDIVRVQETTDVLDLSLDDDEVAAYFKESGKSGRERINDYIGIQKDVEVVKGVKLPTGVVAVAPQLLCVLLMVIFYIIGAIRVFAAETCDDGSPKTGWLKAGGIVGIVMSVITAVEVLVINQFYERVADSIETFHGDLELNVRLLIGFLLFALVSVALTLAATHWGKNRQDAVTE